MASDVQIEEIKTRLEITQTVQQYVPSLKRKGRNYFGLCPFHGEKTASFSVNPELGIFKCFGCGEGGDVLTFLQKIEGLEFREALELAAERAGVELTDERDPKAEERKKLKERAYQAHELAAKYYHHLLLNHPAGKSALDYAVDERKLTKPMLEQFQLGYAPKGYHHLEQFLGKRGYRPGELVQMGLLAEKNGRVYDKFRDRLMHPLFDSRGRVIGFSGRILDPDSKAPKYLNSPETLIYSKSRELYGLFQSKEHLRKRGFAIVMEGNLDVVSSHKVAQKTAVCPLGTALTPPQVKLISRYADALYFCFDTDAAGKKALLRSLEIAEASGINAKAISLGKYKDADDLIRAEPQLWAQVVEQAREIPEYVIEQFKTDFDLGSASEKVEYLELVLPFVAKLDSQVKIDHYLQKLERITGTKYELLLSDLKKVRMQSRANPQSQSLPQAKNGENTSQQESTSEKIKPKVNLPNSKLLNLMAYIDAHREELDWESGLFDIARENLAPTELSMLNLAFNPDSADREQKQVLAHVWGNLSGPEPISDDQFTPEQELAQRLKIYVRERLLHYARSLKSQLHTAESAELTKITARIAEYRSRAEQLAWLLKLHVLG